MFRYTNEQLATIIALPIVTALLTWTCAIFQQNRKRWSPYDIPIVTILVLSILRNLSVLAYTLFLTLNQNTIDADYCSGVVWTFNSIHTFQASSLTTLAIIGLFAVKLRRKQQHLRQFLTSTHVVYHLFCLTTLCACVGVAAILAQDDRTGNFKNVTLFETNPCKFMPYDLDVKFNVFIIVLNVFLASVSLVAFLGICFNHFKIRQASGGGFDYLKNKSSSDLSDLSLGLPTNGYCHDNKNYYDTYTIQRNGQVDGNYYDPGHGNNNHLQGNGIQANNHREVAAWNSDVSNISTTVSSTNSRRPCIGQKAKKEEDQEENRTGLETIHPVLIVCYLFYHLPLIILCVYPNLVAPWPVAGVALWLGLVQDLLIPIGLSIVDSRFCKWVSNVYRCKDKHTDEKLPHVGPEGKFRPFGSQPQSLEITTQTAQQVRSLQAVEHRFPITNGSLYTSIDGRLPVIHNYRRHKDQKGFKPEIQTVLQQQSYNLRQQRQDLLDTPFHQSTPELFPCRNCETDMCPSHSNLHHLSPRYINTQLNLLQQSVPPTLPTTTTITNNNCNILIGANSNNNNNMAAQTQKMVSLSHETVRYDTRPSGHFVQHQHQPQLPQEYNQRHQAKFSHNISRMCRSDDGVNDLNRDLRDFKRNPEIFHQQQQKKLNRPNRRESNEQILDYSSSDEDYLTDMNNADSLSSQSSYSITTEANCDFDFFQNNDSKMTAADTSSYVAPTTVISSSQATAADDNNNEFRILARSDSKRSIQNNHIFDIGAHLLKDGGDCSVGIPRVQRSNSFVTVEDRRRRNQYNGKLLRSDSKMSDCTHNIRQKIKSVEYLPSSNSSTVFIEDVFYFNYPDVRGRGCTGSRDARNYVGSVPDLKKVFISEYI